MSSASRYESPVFDSNDAIGHRAHARVVRHDQEAVPLALGEGAKERENLGSRFSMLPTNKF